MSKVDPTLAERFEDGDFIVSITAHVKNNQVSIYFSSPEHDAEFNFDNLFGLSLAEAQLHPALIKEFIEKSVGDGEVSYYFQRRSDILENSPKQRSNRGRGGQR
jgi:hypothetical protein